VQCLSSDSWKELSAIDLNLGPILDTLHQPAEVNMTPFLENTIIEGWLYNLSQLCVPQTDGRLILIHEAHFSSFGGHFGTTKAHHNL